jgi:hypothetical protein
MVRHMDMIPQTYLSLWNKESRLNRKKLNLAWSIVNQDLKQMSVLFKTTFTEQNKTATNQTNFIKFQHILYLW